MPCKLIEFRKINYQIYVQIYKRQSMTCLLRFIPTCVIYIDFDNTITNKYILINLDTLTLFKSVIYSSHCRVCCNNH